MRFNICNRIRKPKLRKKQGSGAGRQMKIFRNKVFVKNEFEDILKQCRNNFFNNKRCTRYFIPKAISQRLSLHYNAIIDNDHPGCAANIPGSKEKSRKYPKGVF